MPHSVGCSERMQVGLSSPCGIRKPDGPMFPTPPRGEGSPRKTFLPLLEGRMGAWGEKGSGPDGTRKGKTVLRACE